MINKILLALASITLIATLVACNNGDSYTHEVESAVKVLEK